MGGARGSERAKVVRPLEWFKGIHREGELVQSKMRTKHAERRKEKNGPASRVPTSLWAGKREVLEAHEGEGAGEEYPGTS